MLEKVRNRIKERGARGIIGIGRSFRIIDDDGSKCLSEAEFEKCLKDYRISESKDEQAAIFRAIDKDGTGSIDYEEFLSMIRGPMSQRRERLVRKAFSKIDLDNDGDLDITDVKKAYNAKMHPDVRSGKKDEDDILYEFLDTFEQQYALNNPNANSKDRTVSPDEFVAYYENVSCSIDNDDYFETMMTSAWNLDNKKTSKKAWSGEM